MQSLHNIFNPYQLGPLTLKNHFVMASLTRNRCKNDDGIPNDLHIKYYSERAESAGLVLTEAVYVSLNGHAFKNACGIVTQEQIDGWKKVIKSVHDKGGLIFIQLFHCGRSFYPGTKKDGEPIAPSAIAIKVAEDKPAYPVPREATDEDIKNLIKEFRVAAENAKEAGFDGVELHGANGYIIDQFLRSQTNRRTDNYGGSVENRSRLALEIIDEFINVFGADRVGIKLSPVGRYNDMYDSDPIATYSYLLEKLTEKKITYALIYHDEHGGADQIPNSTKALRPYFKGTLITNGDLTLEEAKRRIDDGEADLVQFGKWFISNPDLVERFKNGWPLTPFNFATFFGGDEKEYSTYTKYNNDEVTNA